MTTPPAKKPRSSSGVTITTREIYDELRELSEKVGRVLDGAPEVTNRLNNHADRIRDLEKINAENSGIPAVVATISTTLKTIEGQVNRSAWVPVLVTAVVTAVIVGIALALVTNGLTP